MSPAALAKPECFAVTQGMIVERLDAVSNHPQYDALITRLNDSSFPTPRLSELVISIAGGATPRRSDATLYRDSGIRFLRILNIDDGEIVEQDMKYIAESIHNGLLGRSRLAENDVLLTITGRVGSAAVVKEKHLPANINQHVARLRINTKRCRPEFLSEWLNCPAGLAVSNHPVSGGTRPALTYGAIRNIRIPLPESLEVQDELLAEMDAARAERKAKLEEADALLTGIDDFVLDALEIAPPMDETRRVFAVRLGGIKGAQINPSSHVPELQSLLNGLRIHANFSRWLGGIKGAQINPSSHVPELQSLLNGLRIHAATSKTLGDYVEINPKADVSELGDDDVVGFIPMAAVADGATGEYTLANRPLKEVRKGYTPFSDGDVLWAKITPCMQNGKSCIVDGLPNGAGFGSTEFHVLRVKAAGISKEFVKEFVSQKMLRHAATNAFTGSAGQQRVPADFLANLPFPELSEAQQKEIVAEIQSIRSEARRLRAEAEAGWDAAKGRFEARLLGGAS